MKKILIAIPTILILILINILLIFNIFKYDESLNDAISLIDIRINELNEILTKYKIENSGVLEVNVNYRGAHGENYPSTVTYNYELSDKLYLEDTQYVSINYDKKLLNTLFKLTKLKEIDLSKCISTKKKNSKIYVNCEVDYVNDILNTNFKNINAIIYTKVFKNEIDYIEIYLDDINLILTDDDLIINYLNNNIKINFNKSNYYVNINDLLKANIYINDIYSCNIVIKDKVYYLEFRDNELFIKFNSQTSIYNNISILAKYNDVVLDKSKLNENRKENPIANYLDNSDFNIWRK